MFKYKENLVYFGRVVKIFSGGEVGFISVLFGQDVFFNRKSFPNGVLPLSIGDYVSFRVKYRTDTKNGIEKPVAIDITA